MKENRRRYSKRQWIPLGSRNVQCHRSIGSFKTVQRRRRVIKWPKKKKKIRRRFARERKNQDGDLGGWLNKVLPSQGLSLSLLHVNSPTTERERVIFLFSVYLLHIKKHERIRRRCYVNPLSDSSWYFFFVSLSFLWIIPRGEREKGKEVDVHPLNFFGYSCVGPVFFMLPFTIPLVLFKSCVNIPTTHSVPPPFSFFLSESFIICTCRASLFLSKFITTLHKK